MSGNWSSVIAGTSLGADTPTISVFVTPTDWHPGMLAISFSGAAREYVAVRGVGACEVYMDRGVQGSTPLVHVGDDVTITEASVPFPSVVTDIATLVDAIAAANMLIGALDGRVQTLEQTNAAPVSSTTPTAVVINEAADPGVSQAAPTVTGGQPWRRYSIWIDATGGTMTVASAA